MKSKVFKRIMAAGFSAVMALSLVACGGGSGKDEGTKKTEVDVKYSDIKVGEDYTDIKADLKFLTHKTDMVDTKFKEYIAEFQKLYPNVNIEYEGITNYATDITTRLTTGDWGDICMVPTSVDKNELSNYFVNFGKQEVLAETYESNMLNNFAYEGNIYGIPSMANVQGVVYNKAVFDKAGIKELPKTPDEFIADLKAIKEKTEAVPMYTNFAAGWTMTAWDAYTDIGSTGDPDFAINGMCKGKDPFADRGDGTGPYAVYNTLYQAVKEGLIEEDPTTTDWEGSKGMMNRGEIGCMALGSWAITQIQAAGDNADDIGYMAFPISVNGKQYAAAGPDYCYGINCNSKGDQQIAAMCYVKWLVEKSGFAQSEGGLSIVKNDEVPDALKSLDGVELIVGNPAPEGEENLFNDINNDSELGINVSGSIPIQIVEETVSGGMTFEDMVKEWNEKWTAAQESNDITLK
ncbi:MAG: extracellular solute-binding protein [Lachnospiraceae bacterium]|nr:extracellular solute-binding protein [Lachnospiraceae bacterium]